MKTLSENNQNLDIIELSKMLDSEDMIGFTRKFVDDFEKGVNSISVERFPWIAEIANENWNGIICLGIIIKLRTFALLKPLTKIQIM